MKVLSIQTGHNATVALCRSGEIVGVLGQEKCDNIKNSSAFPKEAIELLLKEVNWNLKDIEKIKETKKNWSTVGLAIRFRQQVQQKKQ